MKNLIRDVKLYYKFRKEVDLDAVAIEAVAWTKASFKRRGVPVFSSEYQNTFAIHVGKYIAGYVHAYAKRRVAESKLNNQN